MEDNPDNIKDISSFKHRESRFTIISELSTYKSDILIEDGYGSHILSFKRITNDEKPFDI